MRIHKANPQAPLRMTRCTRQDVYEMYADTVYSCRPQWRGLAEMWENSLKRLREGGSGGVLRLRMRIHEANPHALLYTTRCILDVCRHGLLLPPSVARVGGDVGELPEAAERGWEWRGPSTAHADS